MAHQASRKENLRMPKLWQKRGSRSKTKHYHHKLGTLDFGFVLTWPTSSWSSCSTARETVAFYGMKPGWS